MMHARERETELLQGAVFNRSARPSLRNSSVAQTLSACYGDFGLWRYTEGVFFCETYPLDEKSGRRLDSTGMKKDGISKDEITLIANQSCHPFLRLTAFTLANEDGSYRQSP